MPHSVARKVDNNARVTDVGSLGITTLGYRRRVDPDGVFLLKRNIELKEIETKAVLIHNRLKHLEGKEESSKKKKMKADMMTDEMIQARERHQNSVVQKMKR
jgi:hypothetical protein